MQKMPMRPDILMLWLQRLNSVGIEISETEARDEDRRSSGTKKIVERIYNFIKSLETVPCKG